MEIEFTKDQITFEKDLNSLDKFTLDFTKILQELEIKYVLVSGYVSILFGRGRSSEDIDILVEPLSEDQFNNLWEQLLESFECITTSIKKEAYDDYLTTKHAIRFSKKNVFIPNMEIKFPKVDIERWALKNRKLVNVNNQEMYISPLELQIPYKIFLGSEKDIEDAKHLYELFKEKLDQDLLSQFNAKLNIEKEFKIYLE